MSKDVIYRESLRTVIIVDQSYINYLIDKTAYEFFKLFPPLSILIIT